MSNRPEKSEAESGTWQGTKRYRIVEITQVEYSQIDAATPSDPTIMKILGFQLLIGDYLARSVRGRPCAPPM